MTSEWRVGMVGLGALGLPIAINLLKAGLNLQVHTRSRRAENDLQLGDARRCANPAAAADNVDVLVLCVSDDGAVNDVLFGKMVPLSSSNWKYRDRLLHHQPQGAQRPLPSLNRSVHYSIPRHRRHRRSTGG